MQLDRGLARGPARGDERVGVRTAVGDAGHSAVGWRAEATSAPTGVDTVLNGTGLVLTMPCGPDRAWQGEIGHALPHHDASAAKDVISGDGRLATGVELLSSLAPEDIFFGVLHAVGAEPTLKPRSCRVTTVRVCASMPGVSAPQAASSPSASASPTL